MYIYALETLQRFAQLIYTSIYKLRSFLSRTTVIVAWRGVRARGGQVSANIEKNLKIRKSWRAQSLLRVNQSARHKYVREKYIFFFLSATRMYVCV